MARLFDGGATSVSYTALDVAKNKLNDLAAQFQNTGPEVGTRHDQALTGAGEFAGQLDLGAVKFLIAWREAFTVCGQCAGLIAANTHNYAVDLKQVDVSQQVSVPI